MTENWRCEHGKATDDYCDECDNTVIHECQHCGMEYTGEFHMCPPGYAGGRAVIRSKPKTVRKRRMVLALDKACRQEVVEARDWNCCQRCGRMQGEWNTELLRPVVIQWAHVHTREYYVTRWEPDNSLALCDSCHVFFDNHKVLSFEWFRKKFPERWEHIQNVLRVSTKTSDAWIRAKYQEMRNGQS